MCVLFDSLRIEEYFVRRTRIDFSVPRELHTRHGTVTEIAKLDLLYQLFRSLSSYRKNTLPVQVEVVFEDERNTDVL